MIYAEDVLFLDFDGVLHPAEVGRFRTPPSIRCLEPGHELFESVPVLEAALAPYPTVKIVLSTTWVRVLGYERARARLSPGLQARVIGGTYHNRADRESGFAQWSRYLQIVHDLARRRPKRWLAIDDDAEGWPDVAYDTYVRTPERLGLACPAAQELLARKLAEVFCHPATPLQFGSARPASATLSGGYVEGQGSES